jgi:cob(I)alamin adenosyltransferase
MGLVHIYCGDGKGKTTASIGLTIRAAGSGMRVLFAQFFKNGSSSEMNAMKLIPNINCIFTDKTFGFYKTMSIPEKERSVIENNHLLSNAISCADNYDLIIFDEIISAYNYGTIEKAVLTDFIKNTKCEIVMTGRNPAGELIDLSDYVSEVKKIKHPFDKGVAARQGIEF